MQNTFDTKIKLLFYLYYFLMISCSLRLLNLKTEGQTKCKQKTSPKSHQTEIKILANSEQT